MKRVPLWWQHYFSDNHRVALAMNGGYLDAKASKDDVNGQWLIQSECVVKVKYRGKYRSEFFSANILGYKSLSNVLKIKCYHNSILVLLLL